jgi:CheY-like chemotaxis protein
MFSFRWWRRRKQAKRSSNRSSKFFRYRLAFERLETRCLPSSGMEPTLFPSSPFSPAREEPETSSLVLLNVERPPSVSSRDGITGATRWYNDFTARAAPIDRVIYALGGDDLASGAPRDPADPSGSGRLNRALGSPGDPLAMSGAQTARTNRGTDGNSAGQTHELGDPGNGGESGGDNNPSHSRQNPTADSGTPVDPSNQGSNPPPDENVNGSAQEPDNSPTADGLNGSGDPYQPPPTDGGSQGHPSGTDGSTAGQTNDPGGPGNGGASGGDNNPTDSRQDLTAGNGNPVDPSNQDGHTPTDGNGDGSTPGSDNSSDGSSGGNESQPPPTDGDNEGHQSGADGSTADETNDNGDPGNGGASGGDNNPSDSRQSPTPDNGSPMDPSNQDGNTPPNGSGDGSAQGSDRSLPSDGLGGDDSQQPPPTDGGDQGHQSGTDGSAANQSGDNGLPGDFSGRNDNGTSSDSNQPPPVDDGDPGDSPAHGGDVSDSGSGQVGADDDGTQPPSDPGDPGKPGAGNNDQTAGDTGAGPEVLPGVDAGQANQDGGARGTGDDQGQTSPKDPQAGAPQQGDDAFENSPLASMAGFGDSSHSPRYVPAAAGNGIVGQMNPAVIGSYLASLTAPNAGVTAHPLDGAARSSHSRAQTVSAAGLENESLAQRDGVAFSAADGWTSGNAAAQTGSSAEGKEQAAAGTAEVGAPFAGPRNHPFLAGSAEAADPLDSWQRVWSKTGIPQTSSKPRVAASRKFPPWWYELVSFAPALGAGAAARDGGDSAAAAPLLLANNQPEGRGAGSQSVVDQTGWWGFASQFLLAPQFSNNRQPTVMLAIGDETARDAMNVALVQAGYMVLPAGTARDAIGVLRTPLAPIDVALVDLHLPDVSGIQLCARLRELYPKLPVMCCADRAEPADLAQLRQLGVHHFFRKPVIMRELLATLKALVP